MSLVPALPRFSLPKLSLPRPLPAALPLSRGDYADDGRVVDVRTGEARDFSLESLKAATYTPREGAGRVPLVFIEGANQWRGLGAERAKRHADRLGVPLAVVHNATLVREVPGQRPSVQKRNRDLENVVNVLLHQDLATERSAKNVGAAMLDAVESGRVACFAGESQGSILVGQAVRTARERYVRRHATGSDAAARARAVAEFEQKAGQTLYVLTFGNAYPAYPAGPNYLHVMMRGDPVPQNGSRPDNRPPDARTRYLVFDQLFAGEKNFENHNVMFLVELMRRSAQLNGVPPGDLPALVRRVQSDAPFRVARPDEVRWPADIQQRVWDPSNNVAASIKAWAAAHPRRA